MNAGVICLRLQAIKTTFPFKAVTLVLSCSSSFLYKRKFSNSKRVESMNRLFTRFKRVNGSIELTCMGRFKGGRH